VQSLFDRSQGGRTLVLNQDDEKPRRLRLASVATDSVNVVGTFIEGLTRVQGDRLLPLDLHDDGACTYQMRSRYGDEPGLLRRADARRAASCPLCRGCRLGPARTTSSPSEVLERRREPRRLAGARSPTKIAAWCYSSFHPTAIDVYRRRMRDA